jgi:hypothetical protein
LLAATPGLACGSLADSGYEGEPLMLIEGSVVSSEANLPPMDVALLWDIDPDGRACNDLSDAVARVSTQGAFPAAFRLMVTQPPPEAAFRGDSPIAEAYIAALDKENHPYGYATNAGKVVYKVFYARREIPAQSADSARFGGTGLRAGYQLGVWDLPVDGPAPVIRLAGEQETVSIELRRGTGGSLQPACTAAQAPGTGPGPGPGPGPSASLIKN